VEPLLTTKRDFSDNHFHPRPCIVICATHYVTM